MVAEDLQALSEQELRDLARRLDFDAEGLLDRRRKAEAAKRRDEVTEELRRRYAQRHPVRVGVNRVFARLLGLDRHKVERHLRSVGRDEI